MSVDCPKFIPGANGRTCTHYLVGGTCNLSEEFMCVAYMKKYHPALYGKSHRVEDVYKLSHPSNGPQGAPSPRPKGAGEPKPFELVPSSRACGTSDLPVGFRLEDIAELKSRGVEAQISTELGDIWLVPKYTHTRSRELSYESLATLVGALLVFPGAQVKSLSFASDASKESSR